MNYTKKYFGTDGIRGKVGEAPITPEVVMRLGWAAGCVLKRRFDRPSVIIGKDTRLSGYMMESALETGLLSAGVDVVMLGPMPTPAVAYLINTFKAQAGIVISASHNPFFDNGIKFFTSEGLKFNNDLEMEIEQLMHQPITLVEPSSMGKAYREDDAAKHYMEYCTSVLAKDIDLSGLKLVVDCAHGATYHIAPDILKALGAHIITLGASPNGSNINHQCGSTQPDQLVQKVKQEQADVGLAFDGDGDRLIMVDHQGNIIDGDQLLYVLTKEYVATNKLKGGVVGTVMSNLGLELALKTLNVPFVRAKVGDKNVLAEMQARHWQLGGESSGHIICLDVTTTGDGILAALQVLAAIQRTGKDLQTLAKDMKKLPQVTLNVDTINKDAELVSDPRVQTAIHDAKTVLNGRGRVLLRPSGTEPVIRVMVEGEDHITVRQVVSALAHRVETVMQERSVELNT